MAFAVFLTVFLFIDMTGMAGLIAAMTTLIIFGIIDDRRELKSWSKLLAQSAAALMIIYWSNVSLRTFGDILSLGPLDFRGLSIPVTVFCIVGVANAFNMIDGADGLAGGVSLIAFLSFTFLSALNGQPALMILSGALCGAVIGFLRYNWHPARLFMGDAGSLFLGCTAAFLSIAITQRGRGEVPPVAPLLILALPITDALTVILKRIVRGRSPFRADRKHIHYTLMNLGLGARKAVFILLIISLLFSLMAIAGTLFRVPERYLFLIFSLYFIIHAGFSICTDYVLRRKHPDHAVNRTLPEAIAAIHNEGFSPWQGMPGHQHGLDANHIPSPLSGPGNQPVSLAAEGELPKQNREYEFSPRR
jgi:UDP-GlcNAc:undecaprenyl-phosphate GlcNAc-1-phosphate transferase